MWSLSTIRARRHAGSSGRNTLSSLRHLMFFHRWIQLRRISIEHSLFWINILPCFFKKHMNMMMLTHLDSTCFFIKANPLTLCPLVVMLLNSTPSEQHTREVTSGVRPLSPWWMPPHPVNGDGLKPPKDFIQCGHRLILYLGSLPHLESVVVKSNVSLHVHAVFWICHALVFVGVRGNALGKSIKCQHQKITRLK